MPRKSTRLPCGRTPHEIDQMIKQVDKFREILLAAKEGAEIEYLSKWNGNWWDNEGLSLDDINMKHRVKPTGKRGTK